MPDVCRRVVDPYAGGGLAHPLSVSSDQPLDEPRIRARAAVLEEGRGRQLDAPVREPSIPTDQIKDSHGVHGAPAEIAPSECGELEVGFRHAAAVRVGTVDRAEQRRSAPMTSADEHGTHVPIPLSGTISPGARLRSARRPRAGRLLSTVRGARTKILYIAGCGRSGSTILGHVLGQLKGFC